MPPSQPEKFSKSNGPEMTEGFSNGTFEKTRPLLALSRSQPSSEHCPRCSIRLNSYYCVARFLFTVQHQGRKIESMKKYTLFLSAACLVLLVAMATSAKIKSINVTAWVSDEACGAAHTKAGGEDCVLKCLRGGADIGHPEWKAQRMVLVTDKGHKIWVVENPEALKGLEGKHVTIAGQLDQSKNSVRVTSASEIKPS